MKNSNRERILSRPGAIQKIVLLLLLVSGVALSARAVPSLDRLWITGVPLCIHDRRGYLAFDDDHIQILQRGTMMTSGAMVGKRFHMLNNYRLQVAASVHYGNAIDETLSAVQMGMDSLPAQLVAELLYGSCSADLQYPIAVSPDASWYWHVGYGAHFAELVESETLNNNPKLRVNDDYLEANRMWSGSVHAGLGFEIAMTSMFGFSVAYTMRYWYPVHYGMVRDLFPVRPIDYHERFFSHEFDIVLLVKRY